MASRWFLIVRYGSCPECGLDASSVGECNLGVAIVEEARLWDDFGGGSGGGSGIRTHGGLHLTAFQEPRICPLCHPSLRPPR
jgi:hypothetical protein